MSNKKFRENETNIVEMKRDVPKREKLIILGWATPTRDNVPYEDESFDIWGCNEMGIKVKGRVDAWFNFHDRVDLNPKIPKEVWEKSIDGHISIQNIEWLKKLTVPVYMKDGHKDIPTSTKYPLEKMLSIFGRQCATSTISYMLALGITQGYKEIHIYGVDMKLGSEYEYQRAGCNFMIGNALGKGINILIAKGSCLMHVDYLYGYEVCGLQDGIVNFDFLKAIHRKLTEEQKKADRATHTLQGARDQTEVFMDMILQTRRQRGLPIEGEVVSSTEK